MKKSTKTSLTCSNHTKTIICAKNLHYLISLQGWTHPTKIPKLRNFTALISYLLTYLTIISWESWKWVWHAPISRIFHMYERICKKKYRCITLSASRAGHARQKFQKCEIMIFLLARSTLYSFRSLTNLTCSNFTNFLYQNNYL